MVRTRVVPILLAVAAGACSRPEPAPPPQSPPPSILLVTLDTTRADAIGPGARGVQTPAFNALAARGRRFSQAYATVPETLPSHVSLMTGLYPAGHGVHENGRILSGSQPALAERMRQAGYRTAAFVSAFVLARRFGLSRGFDVYDDSLPEGRVERTAVETTDRVAAHLDTPAAQPLFLWVHYFDPHTPYEPPEPYRTRHAGAPYLGEVAAMDAQLGRLVELFEKRTRGPHAFVVVADHGEGLGDHGEAQHGNLLYQSTMHVPLVITGPGVTPGGVGERPVSTRRVYHTVLDWAGNDPKDSLRAADGTEIVLGEAMKPFLSYGWQPQRMAVDGRQKVISAGRLEAYDVAADPGETRDIAAEPGLSRAARTAVRDYPVPVLGGSPPAAAALSEQERRKLAALGYVSAGAAPVVRPDAPRPADMVRLFGVLELASGHFVREEYARAVPLLERILAADAHNLDAALRLGACHSFLGRSAQAVAAFEKARAIAPTSPDVSTYLGLHYARGPEWARAVPLLESALALAPDRLPVLEALAAVREKQGRSGDALDLWLRVYGLRGASAEDLVRLGTLAMSLERTGLAIETFEQARQRQGPAFQNDLELGVLYLAAGRLDDARAALDRVPATHRDRPMALFKRAQVSVLLKEPDRQARIEAARAAADATTRALIQRERLFRADP